MAEPQPMLCTPDDDRRFVAEHERGVRHNLEVCFQLHSASSAKVWTRTLS
jgi:hypothetical protein